MDITQARRQSQPVQYDVEDDDDLYETRMPTSARRYRPISQDALDDPISQRGTLITHRRSSLNSGNTSGVVSNAVAPSRPGSGRRERHFPLVPVLIGMVTTILLVMLLSALASWWHTYQDDLHYGRPRTSQLDTVVSTASTSQYATSRLHDKQPVLTQNLPDEQRSHMVRCFTLAVETFLFRFSGTQLAAWAGSPRAVSLC